VTASPGSPSPGDGRWIRGLAAGGDTTQGPRRPAPGLRCVVVWMLVGWVPVRAFGPDQRQPASVAVAPSHRIRPAAASASSAARVDASAAGHSRRSTAA
jgi:hypothetical protein